MRRFLAMVLVLMATAVVMPDNQASARGGASTKGQHIKTGQITTRRDVSTGQATGKRTHKPFTFKKTYDKASPTMR